jgi:hypothetical protein
MLNHVTSAHGDSPECSENSGSDSAGENEREVENEEPVMKKLRTVSSAVSKHKQHGKTSKLTCYDIFVVRVWHAVNWSYDCHRNNATCNLIWYTG